MARFGRKDTGCYADGIHGHQHCREALGWLVLNHGIEAVPDHHAQLTKLSDSLYVPMPDDAWDEDEALEFLNEQLCDDGVAFSFEDGSLYLLETD